MLDKVLAIVSLGFLVAFMGIVIWFVAVPDLTIITVAVLLMAGYDFYRLTVVEPRREKTSEADR